MRLGGGEPPRQERGVELWPGATCTAAAVGGLTLAALGVTLAVCSFGSVEVTELALRYSWITRKVDLQPFTSGRYAIGPFSNFIKFPAVVRTIQFTQQDLENDQNDLAEHEQGNPMLSSRTRDGLDVSIELSFQYQLNKEDVYSLYTTMGHNEDFHSTYTRIAVDRLTEAATRYTANQFFMDRARIGKTMESLLKEVFEKKLFSTIFSFQLRSVLLPQDFENAIQTTEVKKQDVHVAEAERNTTRVALETALMQAERRVQVKSNSADAYAQAVMLENTADIQQFNQTQAMLADSYKGVLDALDSTENGLLAYMQSRVVRDHPSDKTTLGLSLPSVDVNLAAKPAAAKVSS
uniref:Band 7 domain-containing protein n=1 Tax=Alexandrium catenella TaxID=2925 RepID=A0A7S1RVG8_ALECA|mmetsp:Transcript_75103/g.199435  ORF Transcript_75103/g.199435 Transcript_75103/m.199435 type:complete len:350 (+) Transcript_75103:84-1133(+)